jgi:hypothetical protein
MRFKVAAFVLVAVFLSTALTSHANSAVVARGRSSYGMFPNGSLTPDLNTKLNLGGGFSAMLDTSDNHGNDSYLEIDTPNLPGGTLISISGLGDATFDGVFCSPTSFLGSCDPDAPTPTISTAQTNCVGTLSQTSPTAGVFEITSPACTITGNYMMELVFADQTFSNYNLSGLSVSAPLTAPEPGSLVLLGAGLVGLWTKRRSRQEVRD